MKRFDKFTEDVDRIAALRARQKAAVSKFKSGSETPSPKKPESRVPVSYTHLRAHET